MSLTLRRICRESNCTTPVRTNAAVRISRPRIMIDVSLPKPSKARFAGKIPVRMSAIMTPKAVTSAGKDSIVNKTIAARMMMINRMI